MSRSRDIRTEIEIPEIGWTPVETPRAPGRINSFVSGDRASGRTRIAYFQRDADQALVAKVWFGPDVEGPPGHAQSSSIAAVLDETMGIAAARAAGHCVVAKTLRVRFWEMVPLGVVVAVEGVVRAIHTGRWYLKATITDRGGAPLAEASGLFVRVAPERIELPRTPPAIGGT